MNKMEGGGPMIDGMVHNYDFACHCFGYFFSCYCLSCQLGFLLPLGFGC